MSVQESKPYVVRRLRSPASGRISFTVLGPDRRPSEPVERFLSWLHHTERSPNTIRAYAGDLCDFFGFLDQRSYEWDGITVDAQRGDGRLRWREYESNGTKRQAVEIIAESLQYLSSPNGNSDSAPDVESDDESVSGVEDDIPF